MNWPILKLINIALKYYNSCEKYNFNNVSNTCVYRV